MAAEEDHGCRKRKRKSIQKRKFSKSEKVEVRSMEDGFLGSWHSGTVTACCGEGWNVRYHVKYDHILADDGSNRLTDQIRVSLHPERCHHASDNQCNHRGHIRPTPPAFEVDRWDLLYGMCVDVYHMECWWEGVIFDHEVGSEKRKVFFPDLGDEMMVGIDMLRITHDWNEVTEIWQRRGNWLFLVLISEYEQDNYIPVSAKQLWYDLREKEGFQKLGEWTSCAEDLWKELLLEVIGHNLKVVVAHIFQVIGLFDNTQKLELSKAVHVVEINPEADFSETCEMVPFENKLYGALTLDKRSANNQSKKSRCGGEKVVPLSPILGLNMNCLTKSKTSCYNEADFVLPRASPTAYSNPDITLASFVANDEHCKNSNSTCNKTRWLTAGPDMVPEAQSCPNAINEYLQKGKKDNVIENVKKHLLHLKWKIEFMKDKSTTRLRYISPKGKLYYSLRQVCQDLVSPYTENVSPNTQNKQSSSCSYPLIEPPLGNQDPNFSSAMVSSHSEEVVVEPQYCPQAVKDWYQCGLEKRFCRKDKEADVSGMILRAKRHLFAMGWIIKYVWCKDRRLLCYMSPRGKCYNSLRKACRVCMYESSFGSSTSACRDIQGENVCKVVEQQLASERIASASSELELLQPESCSRKHSLLFRRPAELHKINYGGIRKFQRKRNCGSKNRSSYGQLGHVLRSSKRVQQVVTPNLTLHNPRTVLSWLIDNNVVLPRAKVQYRAKVNMHPLKEGRVTREGIKCTCCKKVYTLSGFENHAGSKNHQPAANIFLEDGRSLLNCQMQIICGKKNSFMTKKAGWLKGRWHQGQNDCVCSVCRYGGDLILCDGCPSSFHKTCLGMKEIPGGDWYCPPCCCRICGQNKLKKDVEHHVLNCSQCEHKYHIGCLRNIATNRVDSDIKENWFCNKRCESIFFGLHELLGKPIPAGADNLSWTLLKYVQCNSEASEIESFVGSYSKLNIALDVMHECFEPVEEPYTRRDLVKDVIFSKGSELNRLNFRGFYVILLEKNDEIISVATVRVYGEKVAEIPLVGTRLQYRRLGMCRILMNLLEKKLKELGVQRLVLPAVPSVLNTWIGSFGFSKMSDSERLQFVDYTFLDFQDAVMCHKQLLEIPCAELSPSKEILPVTSDNDNTCVDVDSMDLDGSCTVSDVLQEGQVEEGGTVEQELVDIPTGDGNNGSEDPINPANKEKQHDSEPCVSELTLECSAGEFTFKKESRNDDNGIDYANGCDGVFKCYRRRRDSPHLHGLHRIE